jgi:hypothetical protein
MTDATASTDASTAIDSVVDPESLRDADVPFHEDSDIVDTETFETVADLGDLAPVGITNDDGEVLLLRVTDTCDRKVPTAAVEAEQAFGQAAVEWVDTCTGLEITLNGIVGVWSYEVRLEDSDRTASRTFVTFSGSLVEGESPRPVPTPDVSEDDAAVEAGWYDEMPEDAVPAPGTASFFE